MEISCRAPSGPKPHIETNLNLAAALIGTCTIPDKTQAIQTVAMKAISLPELPPKPSKDIAAKLFPGFVQTELRTSGATIPVFH